MRNQNIDFEKDFNGAILNRLAQLESYFSKHPFELEKAQPVLRNLFKKKYSETSEFLHDLDKLRKKNSFINSALSIFDDPTDVVDLMHQYDVDLYEMSTPAGKIYIVPSDSPDIKKLDAPNINIFLKCRNVVPTTIRSDRTMKKATKEIVEDIEKGYEKQCPICKEWFSAKRSDAVYCKKSACRKQASRDGIKQRSGK